MAGRDSGCSAREVVLLVLAGDCSYDCMAVYHDLALCHSPLLSHSQVEDGSVDEAFLDLLSKCQGHRLDDQRSDFPSPLQSGDRTSQASSDEDDLFETLWRLQGSRIEEQRCQLPPIATVTAPSGEQWQEVPVEGEALSSDELFELIFTSQVRPWG